MQPAATSPTCAAKVARTRDFPGSGLCPSHPSKLRDDLINEARERGDETVVCDIPLLFERRLVDDFDRIVLVDAPRPLRLERLTRDRALGQNEAMNMIAAQMPAELKRARADFIIDNDSDVAALEARVDDVWRALHSIT